jgi:hypothetical protein
MKVRKLIWALIVAVFLSSVPVPVAAASRTQVSSKRHKGKKPKFHRPGKFKVKKFKKLKGHRGASTKR